MAGSASESGSRARAYTERATSALTSRRSAHHPLAAPCPGRHRETKTMRSVQRALVRALSVLSLVVVSACSGARPIPADAHTTVISLDKIDCADCGEKIISDLRER